MPKLTLLLLMAPALFAQDNLIIVSSAAGATTIAPGSLATAYLLTLNADAANGFPDQFGNYPTQLGGYSLDVNGASAQLLYVGGSQINFFMPADANLGDTPIALLRGQMLAHGTANVRPVAPSIFTFVRDGRELGAVLNAVTFSGGPFAPETSQIPGCDNRTRLAIFATGLGLSANRVRARDVRVEAQDGTGAVVNLDVEAAVPAPGFASLEQINFVLASSLRPGTIVLRVIANGVPSNRVQVDLAQRAGAAPSGGCLGHVSVTRASSTPFSATVSLAWPAPAGGAAVQLTASDAAVMLPASLTIPAGQYSASFPVSFNTAQVPKKFGVTATMGLDPRIGGSGSAPALTGNFEDGPACVDGIGFSFPGVVGGNGLAGSVTLTDPAPAGGAAVSLTATNPAVSVAPAVTVAAGQTSASFAIATSLGVYPGLATVIATGACGGSSAVLNVVLTPCIASVSLAAAAVAGGSATTGTATLNAPALAGGTLVLLQSSNAGVMVDSQVVVPEGQISATFTVKTAAVVSKTQANILATVTNCGAASAVMTVNP